MSRVLDGGLFDTGISDGAPTDTSAPGMDANSDADQQAATVDADTGTVARPPWDPPFAVGAPGWRNSTVPFCTDNGGSFYVYQVWSDSRGVFVLSFGTCNVAGNVPCTGAEGLSLQLNDGNGWRSIYRPQNAGPVMGSATADLTGFDGGAIVLSGGSCGITLIDPSSGQAACAAVLPNLIGGAFVAGSAKAYAWDRTNLDRFDGTLWSPYAVLPFAIQALWADDQIAIAVGLRQSIYLQSSASSSFQVLPNIPAGDYNSVWAFAADDIWAGNTAGQLVHYDGSIWRVIETGSTDSSGGGVVQLWGNSGKLFFRTRTEFGRWNGTAAEILLKEDPRIGISGIWGNSPSEIFIALFDSKYATSEPCLDLFLLFFDGQVFHQF